MFTGLIETTGHIAHREQHGGTLRLTVRAPEALVSRLREGDSVAVNGVCLTAVALASSHFSADLAAETIARTTLAVLEDSAVVNLELPTPAGSPLGGHIVQGHIEGTGRLIGLDPIDAAHRESSDWRLRLWIPAELAPYVARKGSIALDGISLTVADVQPSPEGSGVEVFVAIIPHTYAVTHLHTLRPGAAINIETDVLAKYAAQQAAATDSNLTLDYLIANGY
jgi:riboflavin synthase